MIITRICKWSGIFSSLINIATGYHAQFEYTNSVFLTFAGPCLQVAAPSPARVRKSGLLFDVEDEDDDGDFLSAAAFKSSVR